MDRMWRAERSQEGKEEGEGFEWRRLKGMRGEASSWMQAPLFTLACSRQPAHAGSFCFGDADYARNVQEDGSLGEWEQSLWVLTQV